ncbi:hypothetical protein [Nonomuraea africana]|uniref:hypothetical protein n=1 Tax=Nonomuraea africana TaxID=46171 RepID=UPI0033E63DE7
MIGVEDLVKIDRHMTALMSKPSGWGDDLRLAVSSGFIRRSWDAQAAPQSVGDVIDEIDAMPAPDIHVTGEHAWRSGALGVVTTTCTWLQIGADDVQVIRVYTNHSGQWLCEYWQESRYHRPRA